MNNITCPLCESDKLTHLATINKKDLIRLYMRLVKSDFSYLVTKDLDYYKCTVCNLHFYNPLITGDEKFYKSLQQFDWYYMEDKIDYKYAKKHIKPTDKVLDIGSGKGLFVNHIGKENYTGLDFSENAKELAAREGVVILNQSIESYAIEKPQSQDVVTCFQVLEHVPNPKEFIEAKLHVVREKGGKIIISVPSEDGFAKYVSNHHLNMPPHHVTRWSEKTMKFIAQKYNLNVIDIFHEKVEPYHKAWYLAILLNQLLFGSKIIDMSFFGRAKLRLLQMLANRLVKNLPNEMLSNGQCIIAVFEKK